MTNICGIFKFFAAAVEPFTGSGACTPGWGGALSPCARQPKK